MRRLSFLLLPLFACFTAELDPDAAGVFACGDDDPCPGDQVCVNSRCEAEDPPTVEITFPEAKSAFQLDDEPSGTRTIAIGISGTLDLVDPDEHPDNVFGEGHLEVFLENQSVGTIESGALSDVVFFDVQMPNVIGPVRVSVIAMRNDGSRYDNKEAVSRLLFWIDDGTPLVGLLNPWPGTSFGLDADTISVEALVLNFSLLPANPMGDPLERSGHVHIYYDVDLATCFLVPMSECDNSYKATVTTPAASAAIIPDSSAGTAKLSAVLRNVDHSLYQFPPDAGGVQITDEIEIVRE